VGSHRPAPGQAAAELLAATRRHAGSSSSYRISLLTAGRDKKNIKNLKLPVSVPPHAVFPPGLSLVYLFIYKAGGPGEGCLGDFMEWAEESDQEGGFSAPETANIYRSVHCDT